MKRIAIPTIAAVIASSLLVRAEMDMAGTVYAVMPSHGYTMTPAARNSGVTPARGYVAGIVAQEARRYGVPVAIAMEHARRESSFNPAAKNPASTAKGTLQVIRGSHAAIIDRPLSLSEHLRLAGDPYHGTRVGMAHIAAAYEKHPNWSAEKLWRTCHVGGLHNCGTSLARAAEIYRGSAPMPSGRFASFDPNQTLLLRGG